MPVASSLNPSWESTLGLPGRDLSAPSAASWFSLEPLFSYCRPQSVVRGVGEGESVHLVVFVLVVRGDPLLVLGAGLVWPRRAPTRTLAHAVRVLELLCVLQRFVRGVRVDPRMHALVASGVRVFGDCWAEFLSVVEARRCCEVRFTECGLRVHVQTLGSD